MPCKAVGVDGSLKSAAYAGQQLQLGLLPPCEEC
jgi:hypothetical protein